MTASLWLPPSARQAARDKRAAYDRAVLNGMALHARLEEWNRDLREIDPHLELVRASVQTSHPALVPGFYHLIRHNPGVPVSVLVVGDRDGRLVLGHADEPLGFREPDSSLFEEIKKQDLWSDRSTREREKRAREAERQASKRRERERADIVTEVRDRVKATFSPGVSMAQAGPWSYRAGKGKK